MSGEFQGTKDDRVRATNQVLHSLASTLLDNTSTAVQLPQGLLQKIAADVAQAATTEPCGLSGCVLLVTLQPKNQASPLELCQIPFDPVMVPTFVVHLTLQEEKKRWFAPFKSLLRPVMRAEENVPPRVVASTFQLVKRKLYRSEDDFSEVGC